MATNGQAHVTGDHFMSPILALRLTGKMKAGRMLDVGCRDFFISRQFAEAGYRVHGIDQAGRTGRATRRRYL